MIADIRFVVNECWLVWEISLIKSPRVHASLNSMAVVSSRAIIKPTMNHISMLFFCWRQRFILNIKAVHRKWNIPPMCFASDSFQRFHVEASVHHLQLAPTLDLLIDPTQNKWRCPTAGHNASSCILYHKAPTLEIMCWCPPGKETGWGGKDINTINKAHYCNGTLNGGGLFLVYWFIPSRQHVCRPVEETSVGPHYCQTPDWGGGRPCFPSTRPPTSSLLSGL